MTSSQLCEREAGVIIRGSMRLKLWSPLFLRGLPRAGGLLRSAVTAYLRAESDFVSGWLVVAGMPEWVPEISSRHRVEGRPSSGNSYDAG